MKKFIKVCLITGCVCLLSGLLIFAVGFTTTAGTNMSGISIHRFPFIGFSGAIKDRGIFHDGNTNRFDYDFDVFDDDNWENFADEEEFFNYIGGGHHGNHHNNHRLGDGYKTLGNKKISLDGIKEIEIVAHCYGTVVVEGQADLSKLVSDSSCSECIQYKIDDDGDEIEIYIGDCGCHDTYVLYVPEDMEDVEIEFELHGCDGYVNNADFKEIKCEEGFVRNVKGAELF